MSLHQQFEHDRATEKPPRLRHGAKALITHGESVLLLKERHADGTPFWTLPGGGRKPHESAADALYRELREEIHCRGEVQELLDRFVYAHHSTPTITVYQIFDCSIFGEITPAITEGIFDVTWATADDLPTYTLPQVQMSVHSHL